MIELNLLPDIKAKFVNTERTKHLTIVIAFAVCGSAVAIVLILAGIAYGSQRIKLNNLDKQIKDTSEQLQDIDGLNKILTIQNQLSSLPALHDEKPVTSRLFDFLPQITPVNVYVGGIDLKLENSTITIKGTAATLELINKFVDTLKFTQYNANDSEESLPAFSSVVLSSFNIADNGYNYSIDMNFDSNLFSSANGTVTLKIPSITSTRSQTEQPYLLFQEQAKPNNDQNQVNDGGQ